MFKSLVVEDSRELNRTVCAGVDSVLLSNLPLTCSVGDTTLFSGRVSVNRIPILPGSTWSCLQTRLEVEVIGPEGPVNDGLLKVFDEDSKKEISSSVKSQGGGRYEVYVSAPPVNMVLFAGYGAIDGFTTRKMYSFWDSQANAARYEIPANQAVGTITLRVGGPIYRLDRYTGQLQTSVKSVTPQGDGKLLVRISQYGASSYESLIALPAGADNVTLNRESAALTTVGEVTSIRLPPL